MDGGAGKGTDWNACLWGGKGVPDVGNDVHRYHPAEEGIPEGQSKWREVFGGKRKGSREKSPPEGGGIGGRGINCCRGKNCWWGKCKERRKKERGPTVPRRES